MMRDMLAFELTTHPMASISSVTTIAVRVNDWNMKINVLISQMNRVKFT